MKKLLFSTLACFMWVMPVLAQTDHAEENTLLAQINALRTDPKKFLSVVVRKYIADNNLDSVNNSYVSSLIEDLKTTAPMAALVSHPFLHTQAHKFAADMGKTGSVGHHSEKLGSLKDRIGDFESFPLGENCEYGSTNALDILMNLLIDEGITSLGHRKNLLNARYGSIGIAIEPHTGYGTNCVMDFGGPAKTN